MKFMILIEDKDAGQSTVYVRAAAFYEPNENSQSVIPARLVYEKVKATLEEGLGEGMSVMHSPAQKKCSN